MILVDGLDEIEVDGFSRSLSDFALRLIGTSGKIKLIVSCKSTDWNRFARFRDEPSGLAIAMCPNADACSPADNAALAEKRKPTHLSPLSAAEIEIFLDRYVSFFALPERPQGKLKEHCRSPFMLRIASEVYGGRTDSLPNDISVSELCDAWLEKKLARMPQRTRFGARAALRELGKALAEPRPLEGADPGEDSTADSLSEYELCRRCDVPITEPVADELVSQGVLIRIDRVDGPTLRFYFSEVRNFFVARHVLGLQDWPSAKLRDRLPALLRGYVTCEALYWYLPDAPAAHIEVWMSDLVGRVLLFLSSYERILENLGGGIRQGVEPYASGPIGLAYEVGPRGLRRWGLFPCLGSANRLAEIALDVAGADDERLGPYWKLGCHTVHSGGESLFADPAKDAAEYLRKESTEAIRRGRLDESGSLTLQQERVWALVSRSECWQFLKHHARDKWTDSGRPMVEGCLDLGEIARRFQVSFGIACYRSQNGRGLNEGSAAFSIAEENCVRSWAEAQVDAGQTFPEPQPWVRGPWVRGLWAAVCACLGMNAQAIAQPCAPSDLDRILRDDPTALPREAVESSLSCLFSEGINAYRCLIERNFWGLRGLFSHYSRLPVTAVAIVRAKLVEPDTHRWTVSYGFVQADAADSLAQIVFDDDGDAEQARRLLSSVPYSCCTSLRNLLRPEIAPRFSVTRFEQSGGEYAPVRALAYHLIAGEFEKIPLSALDPGV